MTLPRWFDPRTMALSPATVPDDDEEVDEVSIANRGSCDASPGKQTLESTSRKFAASVQVSGFAPSGTAAAFVAAPVNVMGPPAPVQRMTTPSPTKKARKDQEDAAAAESPPRSGRDSIANLLGAGERDASFFRASLEGAKFLDTDMKWYGRLIRSHGRNRCSSIHGISVFCGVRNVLVEFRAQRCLGYLWPKFLRQKYAANTKFEFSFGWNAACGIEWA